MGVQSLREIKSEGTRTKKKRLNNTELDQSVSTFVNLWNTEQGATLEKSHTISF
jgi:hypothetical protein